MFSREMNKILRQAQNDKKENRSLYIIEILKVKHLCYPLEGIICNVMLKWIQKDRIY